MKRTSAFSMLVVVFAAFGVFGVELGEPARTTVGVGTRAFGLGNNFVSLANDVSAAFWNPAGLGFTPVREFSVSLGGFSNGVSSEFNSDVTVDDGTATKYRPRIGNVGLLRSLPTSRGGFAFAIAYQSPYMLDIIKSYHISYMSGTTEVAEHSSYRATGQLNFVTGAFGAQVAPNLAVGAALSMVVGKGTEKREFLKSTDDVVQVDPSAESDDFEDWNSRRYLGYDFRVGLKYSLERFAIGLRIVAPSFIRFAEEYEYVYPSEENIVYSSDYTGRLGSPASAALGVSTSLPFATITSEVEARVPDPYADEDRPLGRWKVGAGGGIEMPLFVETFLLRAGYRYSEYDKYPFMLDYNENDPDLPNGAAAREEVIKDEHLITGGIAFLAGSAIALEMSYGFRFWEIYPVSWRREKHTSHRVLASFTVRY